MKYQVIFLLTFLNFSSLYTVNSTEHPFNHEKFIEQTKNRESEIFSDFLKQYDHYIAQNPDDLIAQIEKCKFIQNAQYDYYNEENPNQELFDSCSTILLSKYPNNPDIIVFRTTFTWGDELLQLLDDALIEIRISSDKWSDYNKAIIYFENAKSYFDKEAFDIALDFIAKSCELDDKYCSSIEYAQILMAVDKKDAATKALTKNINSTDSVWELNRRAALLIELKEYEAALEIYAMIEEMDSEYSVKEEMAIALTELGNFDMAREYLEAYIEATWNTNDAKLQLFYHDLKHQNAFKSLNSYNAYRDGGYMNDPMALIRLELFFNHPFLVWQWRDLLGLLSLLALFLILIVAPLLWILPIYAIGHKFKVIDKYRDEELLWGLKSFWFISVAYLVASFASYMLFPGLFYSLFDENVYIGNFTEANEALTTLVFMLTLAFFTIFTLYKIPFRIFGSNTWKIGTTIGITAAVFFGFRIVGSIYISILTKLFGVSLEEVALFNNIIFISQLEVMNFVNTYGHLLSILFIAILGPIYEEIIFRGIILEASKRYMNFTWANILQAALFALVHENFYLFPYFFGFGLLTGYLNQKSFFIVLIIF
jgi:membrane protease YdiL (CAAX protease family)/tetratricopeptide (TPR) repeat protein